MVVRKVDKQTLEAAARSVHVSLYDFKSEGKGFRFTLKPDKGDKDRYKRTSASYFNQGRRVHAVCWHGYRDYMREVFKTNPDAIFVTAKARYKGSEHFEQIHEQTNTNIGAPICPMLYTDTCDCIYTR
jgi:hypothetical protein